MTDVGTKLQLPISLNYPLAFCCPHLILSPSPPQVTREGQSLPASSYRFTFPVLSAVLSSPAYTPLHDQALAVVALQCSPALGEMGGRGGVTFSSCNPAPLDPRRMLSLAFFL